MALTASTYTQGAGQKFQDALINPDTLADGTLRQRFDIVAFPQREKKKTGTLGVTLSAPVLTLGAVETTGGTFAAATYFWKVTAVDIHGGQVLSNQITTAVLLNGTVAMSWTAVPGAVSYKVYRGTVSNTQNALITTTAALTYIDTGTAGTAVTPPATNTTGTPVPAAARATTGAGS